MHKVPAALKRSGFLFHSRKRVHTPRYLNSDFFVSELLEHFSNIHSYHSNSDGMQVVRLHAASTIDTTVNVLQAMLDQVEIFRHYIYSTLFQYMRLTRFAHEEVVNQLQNLTVKLSQLKGKRRSYAYCVLSLFWCLSDSQARQLGLETIIHGMPNKSLSDSSENPFVPGNIMLSPSISRRLASSNKKYRVACADRMRIFTGFYALSKSDHLIEMMGALFTSLPTVSVVRVPYHRSHEDGCASVNNLTVFVGDRAHFHLTLAHELAHLIYRRYQPLQSFTGVHHASSRMEKRRLMSVLNDLKDCLPEDDSMSFLKSLLVNSRYHFSEKKEEFFCEMFAVLISTPTNLSKLMRFVSRALSFFSFIVEQRYKRMRVMQRESLLVPQLSDLLTDSLFQLKKASDTRCNKTHAQNNYHHE